MSMAVSFKTQHEQEGRSPTSAPALTFFILCLNFFYQTHLTTTFPSHGVEFVRVLGAGRYPGLIQRRGGEEDG